MILKDLVTKEQPIVALPDDINDDRSLKVVIFIII
jgi:hypothetical protein